MSRMSIRYQCWEVSGPNMGYKLAHGQTNGLVAPQCVNDGSTLRRPPNSSHESAYPHFAMYLQSQNDPKGQSLAAHPRDVSAIATVRFASPPISQFPSSASFPKACNLSSEAGAYTSCEVPAMSEAHVATSSVSTESEEKASLSDGAVTSTDGAVTSADGTVTSADGAVTPTDGPCEAQSRRFDGISGSPVDGMPKSVGAHIGCRDLRSKAPSTKPGVIERVVPLGNGYLNGSYAYCPPIADDQPINSSESSSSICQASEDSSACTSEDIGGEEAQSAYRGPLQSSLAALDESLPIKRPGLSKFFGGKSRSFSSLADVSSAKDLAKPNNPYAYIKRRKMGFNCPVDRHRSYPPPTRSSVSSIGKKLPSNSSRNSLAVAVILEQEEQNEQQEQHYEQLMAAPPSSSWISRATPSRSFSLTDLHASGRSPPLRRQVFVRP
ncbi:uncharacterized protein [Physcomitrium patens]|uniref:Uncharacterized protein n=2 Tax=Physcomitrium patens TaxID=3218 RepID=A0A2K1JE19_PHYPA|nr:uncharacterized protein LOC112292228 [Physcomitrium patens]PNR39782.1 hypothetical protein PHYPA_020062 [Physcomitrium patens]|eukprot:XP_024396276.1 uncharacterized protein LOC112292228 [Physcomitrella patens]